MNTIEGSLMGTGLSIALIVSRFNETITKKLVEGALHAAKQLGVDHAKITLVHVPGAFELPYTAKLVAKQKTWDAIVCLGAVIRGATPHFELVSTQTASGLVNTSLTEEVPIIFGVLTTDTIEQAIERSGTKSGNIGFSSMMSAIEMGNLRKQLSS